MSVYKPCDIRGPVPHLSAEQYRAWGQSLGRRLRAGDAVYVGGDVRLSTPAFLQALVEGLASAGLQIHDLGIVPTPMVYFAMRRRAAPACAVVTASHSPPDVNGLKWMLHGAPPTEEMVRAFEREEKTPPPARDAGMGRVIREEIAEDYVRWMTETIHGWIEQGGESRAAFAEKAPAFSVVLDPGYGCWSGRCLDYFSRWFPGVRFRALHDRPDGTFPDRGPDSANPEHLSRLRDRVGSDGANLGIAFDGDGDRVSFVDSTGAVLTAEQTTWVFLRSLVPLLPGRTVVYDVKFSDLIADTVRSYGGVPVVERSGHAFLRSAMQRREALFGAEVSGHFFYEELLGGDDGCYAAARMLWYLMSSGQGLDVLRAECPRVFMTPDLRLRLPEDERQRALSEARRAFATYPTATTDGLRVTFPGGWALMRASVTEPALTFRFEGKSQEDLDRIVAACCAKLGALGERVSRLYARSKAG